MGRRELSSGTGTGATAFETENFAPGSNTLILLFVTSATPVFPGGVAGTPTVTGNGLAWVPAQSVLYGANGDRRLTCFRASGAAPSDGAAVIDFGSETQDFCAWSVFEYSDVDVSGAQGEAAIAQVFAVTATGQSLTASLAPSADPNRNFAVGAVAIESTLGAVIGVSPGAGFTEIDEQDVTPAFLGKAGTLQTEDAAASNTAIAWTWNTAQSAAALVLEVKAAPPADTGGTTPAPANDGALVNRFEPVLFFHPLEKFFPSDAKRYIEHAALWTAQDPDDDKSGWGGKPGDPFPRNPTVPAMGLAAVPNEPGDFRFGEELGGANDHRFLELGGWNDPTMMHEPGVTAQSSNRFSDRNEIATAYRTIPELEKSRFWYHAEVIHEEQLRTIGRNTPGVDLSKVLSRLRNPTLVCYYLFFPAHDQSVGSGQCTNLEASEVSSHAGDWQCMAILGQGTADAFIPMFLGRTGSRPSGPDYPPYQFDDDSATAIIVGAWTDGAPERTDGHPRLYVAQGTHSLYAVPGVQTVDPYPPNQNPQWCGAVDVPTPVGHDDPVIDDSTLDVLVFYAKMIAAGPLGFLGATAALVSCIIEATQWFKPFGVAEDPSSPADPDQPPASPGAGKTVKPAGLSVPDAGTDVVDWRSVPELIDNGRRYSCIVDRKSQPWWPSADTKSGFNGRWGQHVAADKLSRRAGPRFPNYARMFLLALADGDGRGLLKLGG